MNSGRRIINSMLPNRLHHEIEHDVRFDQLVHECLPVLRVNIVIIGRRVGERSNAVKDKTSAVFSGKYDKGAEIAREIGVR